MRFKTYALPKKSGVIAVLLVMFLSVVLLRAPSPLLFCSGEIAALGTVLITF